MRHLKFPYATDPTGRGFFWPASAQKRKEWLATQRNEPMTAESTYQCNPGARQGSVFLESDFSFYQPPPNLALGLRDPLVKLFCRKGETIIQAWDTAFSADEGSDYSVCVTMLLIPSDKYLKGESELLYGPCDSHFLVYLLDVYRDKIPFAELVPKARELWQRWQPSVIAIEKKAYGVPLIEALENTGMVIEPVIPVQGKRARVTDGMGAGVGAGSVQGWFRQGRVHVPAGEPWVDDYVREMKDFNGDKGGVDDQVDATVHGVQWAIRAGGSNMKIATGWETPEKVDTQMKGNAGHNGNPYTAELFGVSLGGNADPFDGRCGRCIHKAAKKNVCTKHGFAVSTLHACFDFERPDGDDQILLTRR